MTTKLEVWVEKRAGLLISVLAALTVFLVAFTVWLLVQEEQVQRKTEGVRNAGPCRAALAHANEVGLRGDAAVAVAIRAPECKRQAYLVRLSCLAQPRCESLTALDVPRHEGVRRGGGGGSPATGLGGGQGGGAPGPGSPATPQPGPAGPQGEPGAPAPPPAESPPVLTDPGLGVCLKPLVC